MENKHWNYFRGTFPLILKMPRPVDLFIRKPTAKPKSYCPPRPPPPPTMGSFHDYDASTPVFHFSLLWSKIIFLISLWNCFGVLYFATNRIPKCSFERISLSEWEKLDLRTDYQFVCSKISPYWIFEEDHGIGGLRMINFIILWEIICIWMNWHAITLVASWAS